MRTVFSSVIATFLVIAGPSLAKASPAEAEIAAIVELVDGASLIAAELGLDLPSPPAQNAQFVATATDEATVAPASDALLITSPPDVPDAAAVLASEEQRRVAAALDAALFADANEDETALVIAQEFATLAPETTGSVSSVAEDAPTIAVDLHADTP